MTAATKKPKPSPQVLCTAYCPVCRSHWQAVLPLRVVTTAGERGQGYPFHPHPTCAAGKGGAS